MLAPVLEQLARGYGEQLVIGKVDTDHERALAAQHGIRSLPTLRLYRNGEVVEEVLGAQPESSLRALIEPYLVRGSDNALQAALALSAAGNHAEALQELTAAYNEAPDNPHLPLPLVRLYIMNGQTDEAETLLSSLPIDLRSSVEGKGLQLLIVLAKVAAAAPDEQTLRHKLAEQPADAEARYQLAARQLVAGDYDAALEDFMALLEKHRSYADGGAQQGLLATFALLGEDDPRVAVGRRRMFALLH